MTILHFRFEQGPRLAHGPMACVLTGLLGLTACGSDGGTGSASQTSIEDWRDYCIATFTADHAVTDPFGDVLFTAQAGDEYVISRLDPSGEVELVYLADAGPDKFTIEAGAPLTHSCQAGATTDYYAVFSDVTVYAEEELSTPICELEAGAVRPRNTGALAGYSIAGTGLSFSGPTTYEVYLNTFSADCGGADRGYVSVPATTSFGATTWLVPILAIVGPA